jgi:hypothetical protein
LGQDNSGRDYVKEGFSINGNSFEVTHFKQEIQTQTIKTGESVEIVLKIKFMKIQVHNTFHMLDFY